MEQHMQYLMWLKSKQIFKSPMNSFNNTWEEQAFAEDTSGPLGGFVWPPRSYSCTFCRREFRSAQALGGHMNIHRRDRARMKQSLSLHNTDDHQFQLQKLSKTPSTGDDGLSSPFSSVSRASSKVTQEHTVETNLSVGINLGDSHNLQLGSGNEESTVNSKRHKSSGISSFAFFHKPLSGDRYAFQQREVLRIKTKPLEDIDLELRLGDPPAVK